MDDERGVGCRRREPETVEGSDGRVPEVLPVRRAERLDREGPASAASAHGAHEDPAARDHGVAPVVRSPAVRADQSVFPVRASSAKSPSRFPPGSASGTSGTPATNTLLPSRRRRS